MKTEELIDKYYQDELTPEERSRMEFRLRDDAGFKAEFEFQENLRRSIKSVERDKLKSRLQTYEAQQPASSKRHWKTWAAAASIAALLGIAGWTFFIGTHANGEKLYAQNYEVYPNTAFNITRGEGEASTERDAFSAYEAHDYGQAIPLFQKLDPNGQNTVVNFYLGQSQLAADQPGQAFDTFEKVIRANAEFKSEAQWYSALAALKLNDRERAKELLAALVSTKGYKAGRAKGLLKKLE